MTGLNSLLDELSQTAAATRDVLPHIQAVCDQITKCFCADGKILTCGNGGSACDAAHLAEELTGKYRTVRRALPAINLCADSAALTCIANDWSFTDVFSRQIEAFGRPGDCLVVFSTSGNSPNITQALQRARELNMRTIALLGGNGGKAASMAELSVIIPSHNGARIQELHTWILHAILETVDSHPQLGSPAPTAHTSP